MRINNSLNISLVLLQLSEMGIRLTNRYYQAFKSDVGQEHLHRLMKIYKPEVVVDSKARAKIKADLKLEVVKDLTKEFLQAVSKNISTESELVKSECQNQVG